MAMHTICFILSSIHGVHGVRRIEEFVSQGYDVKVFGFDRGKNSQTKYAGFEIEIIGSFDDTLPYIKRLPLLRKGILEARAKVDEQGTVWYYLGLDIAFLSKILNRGCPYIYEEADLTYTYFRFTLLKSVFKCIDKYVIRKSLQTVLTSDGFVQFLFNNGKPDNVFIITNRMNSNVLSILLEQKVPLDMQHLKFGFVGSVRFDSIYQFVKTIVQKFPQHQVLIYGTIDDKYSERYNALKKYKNFTFLGRFSNPIDLPKIYASLDLVISTYDVCYDNVKYAEPNKLYEAVYFETPIIATKGTFLASEVEELGVGYSVEAMNEDAVTRFVSDLTETSLQQKIDNCHKIDKSLCINENQSFFNILRKKMEHL